MVARQNWILRSPLPSHGALRPSVDCRNIACLLTAGLRPFINAISTEGAPFRWASFKRGLVESRDQPDAPGARMNPRPDQHSSLAGHSRCEPKMGGTFEPLSQTMRSWPSVGLAPSWDCGSGRGGGAGGNGGAGGGHTL